jgi:NAD(P)-dependent dehydrogenase (short-subunit alcohol dehydrogenase family)
VAIVTGAGGGLGRPHALALANTASVTDDAAVLAMVQQALDAWGRVAILVNNAGILRDKSLPRWRWTTLSGWSMCT